MSLKAILAIAFAIYGMQWLSIPKYRKEHDHEKAKNRIVY